MMTKKPPILHTCSAGSLQCSCGATLEKLIPTDFFGSVVACVKCAVSVGGDVVYQCPVGKFPYCVNCAHVSVVSSKRKAKGKHMSLAGDTVAGTLVSADVGIGQLQEDGVKDTRTKKKTNMHCDICAVSCPTQNWEQHCQGKRHQKAEARIRAHEEHKTPALTEEIPIQEISNRYSLFEEEKHCYAPFRMCHVCDVRCDTRDDWTKHSKSAAHATLTRRFKYCESCKCVAKVTEWSKHCFTREHYDAMDEAMRSEPVDEHCTDCGLRFQTLGRWTLHLLSDSHIKSVAVTTAQKIETEKTNAKNAEFKAFCSLTNDEIIWKLKTKIESQKVEVAADSFEVAQIMFATMKRPLQLFEFLHAKESDAIRVIQQMADSRNRSGFKEQWQAFDKEMGVFLNVSEESNKVICRANVSLKSFRYSHKAQSYTCVKTATDSAVQTNVRYGTERKLRMILLTADKMQRILWKTEAPIFLGGRTQVAGTKKTIRMQTCALGESLVDGEFKYRKTASDSVKRTDLSTGVGVVFRQILLDDIISPDSWRKTDEFEMQWQYYDEKNDVYRNVADKVNTGLCELKVGECIPYHIGSQQYKCVKTAIGDAKQSNLKYGTERHLRMILVTKCTAVKQRIVWQWQASASAAAIGSTETPVMEEQIAMQKCAFGDSLMDATAKYTYEKTAIDSVTRTEVDTGRMKVFQKTLCTALHKPDPSQKGAVSKIGTGDFEKTIAAIGKRKRHSRERVQRRFLKAMKDRAVLRNVLILEMKPLNGGANMARLSAFLAQSALYKDMVPVFHGTALETVDKIIANGFNRDYSTRAAYGKGIYFGATADVSHSYARADRRGVHYMFAGVIGIAHMQRGNSSITTPPITSDGKTQVDTLVDSVSNPLIYVVMKDDRVVPLWLISHKTGR